MDVVLNEKLYPKFCMLILPGLCSDILLGLDFLSQHQSVSFQHNGPKSPLTECGLSVLKVESPDLLSNLTSDVHPIATKSRRYCREDQEFIASEVRRLLNEGIIEPSNTPWRAKVVVTRNENNKKRMVVDYSQTVNRSLYWMHIHCLALTTPSVPLLCTEYIVQWICTVPITK